MGRPRNDLELDKSRSGNEVSEVIKAHTAAPSQAELTASNRIATKCLNSALCVGVTDELDDRVRFSWRLRPRETRVSGTIEKRTRDEVNIRNELDRMA